MLVNRALKLLSLAALFWSLTACQTNTKTRNELSFPSGIHTWQKGQIIISPSQRMTVRGVLILCQRRRHVRAWLRLVGG